MKFNRAKFKVLHLCWGNPKYKHRQGEEWIESNSDKDLWVLMDENLNMS